MNLASRLFFFISLVFCINACNSDKDYPSEPIPELTEFNFTDFSLIEGVTYFEQRVVPRQRENSEGEYILNDGSFFWVSYEFDSSIKSTLPETLLFNLNSTYSSRGFFGGCMPSSCGSYFAYLKNETTFIIDNKTDFLSFIGEVDTLANLQLLLRTNTYSGLFYKKVNDGYEVVANQFSCGNSIKYLLQISKHRDITVLETIEIKDNGTVC
jgi:hypothetical protein